MTTILITGAGGAAVPSVIRSLQSQGYRVLAADMDRGAAGLYVADKGYVIPAGKSDAFQPAIWQICQREDVRVLIPLVDEELIKVKELENVNLAVLLPRKGFVELCLDKYKLMTALKEAGIPVPSSYVDGGCPWNMKMPVILKPRVGRGSRDVKVAHELDEVYNHIRKVGLQNGRMLVQQFIQGTEYTVSVVSWRDGSVQAVVPKEVILKAGVTQRAVTRRHGEIEMLCQEIARCLRPNGPFNVQCIVDAEGKAWPFEINPRFSSSVSLTQAAGVDEVGALVAQSLGGPKEDLRGWLEGLVMIRQILDHYEDEEVYLSREIEVVR
jgi:carbamoyl-phosphate synthase large subunit